ncbi:MAG TPA: TonB-dependent receptor [Methylophaga aminisulfidivorans]|uniref:TonB-dependent siderophore receptor n=1 Tax=Methylophaga TaxID=40222 RepID=UPI00175B8F48|nr:MULTISPECIES: TonB-dependent receptor [Methylophaga]HIC47141.1 TonB-dependent receptor [Methylophaga sp.]HIM38997.1 TonB-dependent receptor [Methylophaga aminisulfidivorans]
MPAKQRFISSSLKALPLLIMLASASVMPSTAIADDVAEQQTTPAKLIHFNIPADNLSKSLNLFSAQSGIFLSSDGALTKSKTSAPVNGQYTAEQALQALLAGTQLSYRFIDDNTVTLLEQQQQEQAVHDLAPLVVMGTDLNRYEFDIAGSATGFDTDVNELPRSVQVLPEQLILDQNATHLDDVLQNVAGITRAHGFGGVETQVNIRGFTNNRLFVDGNPVSNRHNVDVATIDRVEAILGPASVLHGQVSPGGLINIITKKPQTIKSNSLQADFDEHGRRKLTLDSTGPLNDVLQYRLIVAGEDSESFRETQTVTGDHRADIRGLTIAPSFSYTPDANNTFTLSLLHVDQTLPIDRGTVAVADASGELHIANLPEERRLGSQFDERDSTEKQIQFDFDHEFDNGWKNQLKLGYYQKKFDDYQARPLRGLNDSWTLGTGPVDISNLSAIRTSANGSAVQANGLLIRTADSNLNVTEDDFFISNSLTGDYRFGDIDNTLYIGANLHKRNIRHTDGFAMQNISGSLYAPYLDVIDIYSSNNPAYTKQSQTSVSKNDAEYTEYGLSIQNLAYLTDRLNLLAGLRYDRFEIERNDKIYYQQGTNLLFTKLDDPLAVNIKGDNHNVSGQVGLLYHLTDAFSVYGSWSESFTPNYPDVTAGQISGENSMAPEEATQYELGIKSSFLDDKVRVTASLYQLTRENVMTFENLQARLNGEEKTKGVELTTTMQFIPGLNILASYTHMDSEIINDNDDTKTLEGNCPYGIPQNKARVWGSYEFQQGILKSFGLGLGAEYVGARYGDDENSFKIPSYTIVDTAAWYYIPMGKDKQLRLQAGIKNLTDKTYYPANLGSPYRINVGAPRTAYISARLEF